MSNSDTEANIKCLYENEARVLQVPRNVKYDHFVLKVSQEFGMPLEVDQYKDAEGTLIKLGELSVLNLSAQLNYQPRDQNSLYDLTVYMRKVTPRKRKGSLAEVDMRKKNFDVPLVTRKNSLGHYSPRSSKQHVKFNVINYPKNVVENVAFRKSMGDERELGLEYGERRISLESLLTLNSTESEDEIVINPDSWNYDDDMYPSSGKTPPKGFGFLDSLEGDLGNHLSFEKIIHSPSTQKMITPNLHITIPPNSFDTDDFENGNISSGKSHSSSALRTPTYTPGSFSTENEFQSNIHLPTFHQQPFPEMDFENNRHGKVDAEETVVLVDSKTAKDKVSRVELTTTKDSPQTRKRRPKKGTSKPASKEKKNGHQRPDEVDKADNSIGILNTINFTWKKGALIGKGAFGNVYKGLLSTGQFVAVKHLELPPDINPEKNSHFQSFIKEIELLKGLDHPNIVRYMGSMVENNNVYVFLEFVSGGSIASIISSYGFLEEEVIKTYARQILHALDYLHKNKIVHRDIKGANILIDPQGSVKLADFGCSKMMELKSCTGDNFNTLLGTPFWMAPEVMTQQGHGRKADIWSFGCTLIEMASGQAPWSSQYTQIAAFLFDIASSQKIPEIPSHLSNEMADLLKKCFNRDPSKRPSADELLEHPWFKSSSSQPPRRKSKRISKKTNHFVITEMSPDILLNIFRHLPLEDLASVACTCHKLSLFLSTSSSWQFFTLSRWPKLRRYHSLRGASLGGSLFESEKLSHWQKLYISGIRQDKSFKAKSSLTDIISLKGHSKPIYQVKLLESSNKVITCSSDHTLKIWNIGQKQEPEKLKKSNIITLNGHEGSVTCFTTLGEIIWSGSKDKTIRTWRMDSSKCVSTMKSHRDAILCMDSCLTTKLLATASIDGVVKIWDTSTTSLLHSLDTHKKSILDVKLYENILAASFEDGIIKCWDVRSGNKIRSYEGHTAGVSTIDILGDTLLSGSLDGTVREWSLASTACKTTIDLSKEDKTGVLSLQFDGFNTITVLKNNGRLCFIDYNKEEVINTFKVESGSRSFDRKGGVIATCGRKKNAKVWVLR